MSALIRFKTSWESVSALADNGRFYRGEVAAEEIPDEHWNLTEVEHDGNEDRLDQYRTLKRWAETGEELVRNVRLWQAREPVWSEVTDV